MLCDFYIRLLPPLIFLLLLRLLRLLLLIIIIICLFPFLFCCCCMMLFVLRPCDIHLEMEALFRVRARECVLMFVAIEMTSWRRGRRWTSRRQSVCTSWWRKGGHSGNSGVDFVFRATRWRSSAPIDRLARNSTDEKSAPLKPSTIVRNFQLDCQIKITHTKEKSTSIWQPTPFHLQQIWHIAFCCSSSSSINITCNVVRLVLLLIFFFLFLSFIFFILCNCNFMSMSSFAKINKLN